RPDRWPLRGSGLGQQVPTDITSTTCRGSGSRKRLGARRTSRDTGRPYPQNGRSAAQGGSAGRIVQHPPRGPRNKPPVLRSQRVDLPVCVGEAVEGHLFSTLLTTRSGEPASRCGGQPGTAVAPDVAGTSGATTGGSRSAGRDAAPVPGGQYEADP